MGSNNTILLDMKNQLAREGIKSHIITFDQPGIVTVKIKVTSVKGVTTGIFTEQVEFQIPVK
jgi:putative lipase involved disintegration of autophagic bodies